MNIHHLELFYFVAKHGGIAAAVRNIPYGIQQPAVSGQIAKLEESLGTKLFQRRPFALSPAGAELFEFIRPFFDSIDIVAEKMRQNSSPQLRIAAPSIVLHDYVPELLQKLRVKFPTFRLYLHEAARVEAERLLLAQDVDLAITLSLGVEWFCGIEVSSARLIERYVASGYGIGLAVAVPGFKPSPQVRALPLPHFPPVVVGAAWSGKLSNIAQQLLTELETEAQVQMRRMKRAKRR